MRKANALIFPSIWLEPFGLVITEAFSNGCCVISKNIGAPGNIGQHRKNGLHFKSNSEEDLIMTIETWESLTEVEKNNIRNSAFETFIENYSPEKQKFYFDRIYTDVLKKNK